MRRSPGSHPWSASTQRPGRSSSTPSSGARSTWWSGRWPRPQRSPRRPWRRTPREPVLKGFIIGLALTIIVGQLPKLFGVEKGDGDFFEQLWDLLRELGDTSGLTLLVGLLSLGLVVLLKERAPDQHGVAIVGNIDGGLPSLGLPDAGLEDYLDLGAVAFGVMFVGFAEGVGAAKTYAT